MSVIPIFYEHAIVGRIENPSSDAPFFVYEDSWLSNPQAFQISVQAPMIHAPFASEKLLPWLANLLPEGDQLEMIGRNLGAAPGDLFGLLERLGGDTAGALSFGNPAARKGPQAAEIKTIAEMERIINEMPSRPFLAGEEGVSMSLAGAQAKLPLIWEDGTYYVPLNGAPSTHILKPDNPRLIGSVQNEAMAMVLARLSGLQSAEVTTGIAGERTFLLVTRYDRQQVGERWVRIHQEDFCQALGRTPSQKYEHNQTGKRGPGVADLIGAARRYLSPGDVLRLLDAVVFNVLLTNVDSHAKNYSLLLAKDGTRLAPLYDLMVGDAWPNITANMAQDVGGQRRGAHVSANHWERMARESGFTPGLLLKRIEALAHRVNANVDAAVAEVERMPAGGHFMLGLFGDSVKKRVKTVLINLTEGGASPKPRTGGPEVS